MSKLDSNERWKSKMLLTEHQEQYESRNDSKKISRPTSEELKMIRDYILLPYMLTMVQKSVDDIERTPNLLKKLYLTAGQVIMNKISNDIHDIRRELTKRNIKIISDEHMELVVYHRFLCRGYEDRFGMTRDVMRSEISVQLTKYIKEIISRIDNEK